MPPVAPPAAIGLEGQLLTFAASLLVSAAALHAGTHVVADARDYGHAVLTALLGALVWAILEPVPLLGGLLAAVAWIAVVRWRYHSAGSAPPRSVSPRGRLRSSPSRPSN